MSKDRSKIIGESTVGSIRVAVCGELRTACDYLRSEGVADIDVFSDATEIVDETRYHLILIYAPSAEGLFNTHYCRDAVFDKAAVKIPIRLLDEPCCHSALMELKYTLQKIIRNIEECN